MTDRTAPAKEASVELLPCPFCNADLERVAGEGREIHYLHPGFSTCFLHGIDVRDFATWNRRSSPVRDELLESLKAATERCQVFLDTFGDMGENYSTAADIGDWHDAITKATL